jgi:polar amino acid transport system substrate-binding protein
VTLDFPPYSYIENCELTGMATEVLMEILSDVGMMPEIRQYPWKRAVRIANTEKNVLIYTIARTPQREMNFHFIGEVAPRNNYFFKLAERKDIQIDSLEDLKKYKIGVVRGYATDKTLTDIGLEPSLFRANSDINILRMLFKGHVDLCSVDEMVAKHQIRLYNKKARKVGQELLSFSRLEKVYEHPSMGHGRYLAFGINTSHELVRKFQDSFRRMVREGRLEVIRAKYLQ